VPARLFYQKFSMPKLNEYETISKKEFWFTITAGPSFSRKA